MDEEDDYDDFGDELENDLASDGEADGKSVLIEWQNFFAKNTMICWKILSAQHSAPLETTKHISSTKKF